MLTEDDFKSNDNAYHNPWNMTPTTPRPHCLGAAELTQKFKRQTEDLIKASSPKSPWVMLIAQRPQRLPVVLQLDTDLEIEPINMTQKDQFSVSPSERAMVVNDSLKNSLEKKMLTSFNADSFLKLHALCASSSSSIEMIRM